MSFKKFLFVFSTVLFSFVLNGQSLNSPAIKAKLDAFIQYSNNQEWDKAFDLLYPKLFTKVSKQDLIDIMMGMESDGLTLNMSNTRITSTSVPVVSGTETFIKVSYTSDLLVTIKPKALYDSYKSMVAIDEQFKATYGVENVKLDQDKKQYQIKASKSMMAIQSGTEDWKLVEINMEQPDLMAYLFPANVMETLVRSE
jgi:hypothetical protein